MFIAVELLNKNKPFSNENINDWGTVQETKEKAYHVVKDMFAEQHILICEITPKYTIKPKHVLFKPI